MVRWEKSREGGREGERKGGRKRGREGGREGGSRGHMEHFEHQLCVLSFNLKTYGQTFWQ